MISRHFCFAIGAWLVLLAFTAHSKGEVIGVYDVQKLKAERLRLEPKLTAFWNVMFEKLLTEDEKVALQNARLSFPTLDHYKSHLNFYTDTTQGVVYLPIHSLLFLEDACTAYAWLHHNGFSPITINEYSSMLKYRPTTFPGGEVLPPLKALGIPDDALSDKPVAEMSLRFRNSAYAYVLAHEMGHILRRHRGNNAVPPEKSRADEREADEFALQVLRRDNGEVPIGAILYFQMTAFTTGSPQRFDFPTIEEWQEKLRTATHPLTSNRVLGLAKGLRDGAHKYGRNREIAKDIADKLDKFAQEYDDRDWQLYFKRIGERSPPFPASPAKGRIRHTRRRGGNKAFKMTTVGRA